MKGISPLIASILLIAFTVAVAGILSTWILGFTRTTTETVEGETTEQLECVHGGISFSNLKYGSATGTLGGQLTNTGTISLGGMKIQVVYTNKTVETRVLCMHGSSAKNCTSTSISNVTLSPGEVVSFNISGQTGYEYLYAVTNCSAVRDTAVSGDVTS